MRPGKDYNPKKGVSEGRFVQRGKVYRRKGSAYDWTKQGKEFFRVKGTARFGPGQKPQKPRTAPPGQRPQRVRRQRSPESPQPQPGAPQTPVQAQPQVPPPDDFLAPLTAENMGSELQAATQLRYGPKVRELEQTRRIIGQQTANVGSWYDDYAKRVQEQAQRQGADQAQQQYLQARATNAIGEKARAGEDAQRRSKEVDQLAQELADEVGLFQVDYRSKAREGERKYALEQQVFGLDVAKTQQDVISAEAERRLDARKLRTDTRQDRAAQRLDVREQAERERSARAREAGDLLEEAGRNARDNGPSGGGGDGGSTVTDTQARAYQEKYQKVLAGLQTSTPFRGGKFTWTETVTKWDKKKKREIERTVEHTATPAEMVQLIVAEGKAPLPIARAAVRKAAGLPMPPRLVRRVGNLGVRVRPTTRGRTENYNRPTRPG